jgi:hypothetical protein
MMRVLLAALFFVGVNVRASTIDASIQHVLERPRDMVNRTVQVHGRVTRINYVPEIRDGASTLSFSLSDGTRDLRVLTPLAPTLATGQQVTVRGTLTTSAGTPELDARAGDIHLIETAQTRAPAPPTAVQGVPVVAVDTPLTIAVSVAAITQALFAVIAVISIIQHKRRYNLGLAVITLTQPHIRLTDNERELHLALRVLSTHAMSPWLARNIELDIHGRTLNATTTLVQDTTAMFPVLVRDDLELQLTFTLPPALPAPAGTPCVVRLSDAFTRRTFTAPLTIAVHDVAPPEALGADRLVIWGQVACRLCSAVAAQAAIPGRREV